MRRILFVCAAVAAVAGHAAISAQIPGPSINMVSGTTFVDGDPFLQRQNEPSIAVSSRNPCHLLAGSNDYRTVDLPGVTGDEETKDAWLGVFKSYDCGNTWRTTLVPGYPQDPNGAQWPIFGRGAGADPVVRAGTNGLFYYLGLAFDRGANGLSKIFVARYTDRNQEFGDSIVPVDMSIVDSGTSGFFLDKPGLAVDIPRPGAQSCTVDGQTFPAGNVYAVYSSFVGQVKNNVARLNVARSTDCGVTWQKGSKITEGLRTNQGATVIVHPVTGAVFVAWRQFSLDTNQPDAMMIARSTDFGLTFSKPTLVSTIRPFDQKTAAAQFRTNAFPTMAIDGLGRIYMAWAARGFATARPDPVTGDARIVMSTSTDGTTWTMPRAVDNNTAAPGHQFMPSLAFAAGKLQLIYYDLREDHTFGTYGFDSNGLFYETRVAAGDLAGGQPQKVFWDFVLDMTPLAYSSLGPLLRRHTLDVRSAQAGPGASPQFTSSTVASQRLSNYRIGGSNATSLTQLEFNPPNLPLYGQGTLSFIGDYIDVAGQWIIPQDNGWAFNTIADRPAIFHGTWTDNRDVRPPVAPFTWQQYTPPSTGLSNVGCIAGTTGMRNANIYTSRIAPPVVVSAPGNSKPLDALLPRAFAVVVQNTTTTLRHYRMTLPFPGVARASFLQFATSGFPDPLLSLDVSLAPLSSAARTVWVTSTNPHAIVAVDVREISAPGGSILPDGNTGSLLLNPDATNPAITNPAITNETFNPAITNPAITNPAITNPAITNPAITNPAITNPAITNPAITNPAITNPAITNEEVADPAITNPAITNDTVQNGVISDVTWTVTNTGNTASAYSAKLVLNQPIPSGFIKQLILHKTYITPAVGFDCNLGQQNHDELIANILNPTFTDLSGIPTSTITDPAITNATLALAPGETGKITLRIADPDKSDNVIVTDPVTGGQISVDPNFDPRTDVTTGVVAESVNTVEAAAGSTQPPVVVSGSAGGAFLTAPFAGLAGQPMTPTVRMQVRDSTGAVVPGAIVTLLLDVNPTGAIITGNSATADVNGFVQFPALTIDRVGLGYVIRAEVGGTVIATSSPFNILEACLAGGVFTINQISVEGPGIVSLPIVTRVGANFDNDGFPDAAVLHGNGLITRMRNNGAGSIGRSFQFNSGAGFVGPNDLALGDFNEDGLTDVAVSFGTSGNVGISLSNLSPGGDPLVDVPFAMAPSALATGDFDRDGHTDLAIVSSATSELAIRYGNGDGTFSAASAFPVGAGSAPAALAVGDVNGDSIDDAVVSTSVAAYVLVFRGATDRVITTLGPFGTGASSSSITLGRFNADSSLDVAIGDIVAPYSAVVLMNDGSGSFGPPAAYSLPAEPRSIAAADFNSDGRDDIVVAIPSLNEARALFNDGLGAFVNPRSVPTSLQPVHVTAGDLNGDGRPELIVTNNTYSGPCCDNIALVVASCGAPTANLVTSVTPSTGAALPGQTVTFTTIVTNNGPFPAAGVTLRQSTTAGTWTSVTPSTGSCAGMAPTTCSLGTLAVGGSATVTIDVTMPATSGISTTAVATAPLVDLVPSNNSSGTFVDVILPSTFIVTSNADAGPGTLRQAIIDANAHPGPDTIQFNLPAGAGLTISLGSQLPGLDGPVNINGASQPGFGSGDIVEVRGPGIAGTAGFIITPAATGTTIRGLSILNWPGQGIRVNSTGNRIAGNRIGIDRTGVAVPNGEGIFVDGPDADNNVIGGNVASDRNIISGNNGHGVMITGGFDTIGNVVIGNYIGTNVAGTAALANGGNGIVIQARSTVGGTVAGQGNLISGNGQNGISVSQDDNESTIQGNFIGTDVSGTLPLGNGGNGITIGDTEFSIIGGTTAEARNIISANGGNGISLNGDASATTVQGNYIGMTVSGTGALPNAGNGITITGTFSTMIGGTVAGARNLISANGGNGVVLNDSRGSTIQGNYIGTDITGVVDFGNGGHGISLFNDSSNTVIGGPGAAMNLVSENGFDGISIDATTVQVQILENSIHSNGGLGIDLEPDGETGNDPQDVDGGANLGQNRPTLSTASTSGAITGNLDSSLNATYVIRFYRSAICSPSGFGEGQTYLGSTTAVTDGTGISPAFNVNFGALTAGDVVAATATDAAGNTSEFSACVTVVGPEPSPLARAFDSGSWLKAPAGIRRERIVGR